MEYNFSMEVRPYGLNEIMPYVVSGFPEHPICLTRVTPATEDFRKKPIHAKLYIEQENNFKTITEHAFQMHQIIKQIFKMAFREFPNQKSCQFTLPIPCVENPRIFTLLQMFFNANYPDITTELKEKEDIDIQEYPFKRVKFSILEDEGYHLTIRIGQITMSLLGKIVETHKLFYSNKTVKWLSKKQLNMSFVTETEKLVEIKTYGLETFLSLLVKRFVPNENYCMGATSASRELYLFDLVKRGVDAKSLFDEIIYKCGSSIPFKKSRLVIPSFSEKNSPFSSAQFSNSFYRLLSSDPQSTIDIVNAYLKEYLQFESSDKIKYNKEQKTYKVEFNPEEVSKLFYIYKTSNSSFHHDAQYEMQWLQIMTDRAMISDKVLFLRNLREKGPFGRTPIYFLLMMKQKEFLSAFSHIALLNVVDEYGISPLDVAKALYQDTLDKDIVEILEKEGALTGQEIRNAEILPHPNVLPPSEEKISLETQQEKEDPITSSLKILDRAGFIVLDSEKNKKIDKSQEGNPIFAEKDFQAVDTLVANGFTIIFNGTQIMSGNDLLYF